MPKNRNFIIIIITLESIEKIKTEIKKKQNKNSLNNHVSVYRVNVFYVSSLQIHNASREAGQELQNLAI